jgi:catechol 2,3-dioxygenase-like lactoylglutathione lyase family enzyme
MRLTAAVIFVRDLQRSEEFYRRLLELDLEMTTGEALLLSAEGVHLVLRALERAPHTSGNLGVQYLIWAARDADDLDRCEQFLKARDAHVSTWSENGISIVEGHDPDRVPILLTYPAEPALGVTTLSTRLFTY